MEIKKKCILLVYGSGGHNEQMKRIISELHSLNKNEEFQFISLCDKDVKYPLTTICYWTNSVTEKFSYLKLLVTLPLKLLKLLIVLISIRKNHKVDAILSTGPGISIVTALFFKLFSKTKIIHVETWSRFYSKSLTGRIVYYMADVFYVQNSELLALYPNATYKGRL